MYKHTQDNSETPGTPPTVCPFYWKLDLVHCKYPTSQPLLLIDGTGAPGRETLMALFTPQPGVFADMVTEAPEATLEVVDLGQHQLLSTFLL